VIKPRPKSGSAAPRTLAIILTAALLFGVQLGLQSLAVPAFASSRETIRELDPLMLERFMTPPAPEASETPGEEEPVEEIASEEAEVAPSFEEEVGSAMEELERRFAGEEAAPPDLDRAAAGDGPAAPGISADATADRFESLFGAAEGVVVGRATRGRTTPTAGAGGLGLGITERGGEAGADTAIAGGAAGAGPDVMIETAADRTRPAGEEVEIGEFEAERFDGSEADLLARWLRRNPSDLPVGVRVHVNFQPSFLTAAVPFTANGRRWDLYLMFNETLSELHIVLVEGERSVYLIDRGFQEQSRSLREGTVRRSGGEIIAIDSRTGAASSDRAQEFYNVFLSWWESARNDVGTP
jgi:hypothetical protein